MVHKRVSRASLLLFLLTNVGSFVLQTPATSWMNDLAQKRNRCGGLSCTSINREDVESALGKKKNGGRNEGSKVGASGKAFIKPRGQKRFIHPQVMKMFQRAKVLERNGNNAVAHRLLKRCLELNPYDSHSWLALARLEVKLGNVVGAREVFGEGHSRSPRNVHILHAWGHMEQKYGNEQLARECWSRAMELDPYNAYVCHALGNLEKRQRNFDRAKEVLENVVRHKPTSALCVSLADLERSMGEPEKAREVLTLGLRSCKQERSKLLLALAWLEEDAFDDLERAHELIEEAMRVDGRNVRVYIAKASMELRCGEQTAARKVLRRAVSLEAEDGQHYTMWGTLELESGRVAEARHILKEGSKRYPGDQFLLQRWGTLEAKYGSIVRARELFDRSVRIKPHAPTFVAWAILEEREGLGFLRGHLGDLTNSGGANAVTSSGAGGVSSVVKDGDLFFPSREAGGKESANSNPNPNPNLVTSADAGLGDGFVDLEGDAETDHLDSFFQSVLGGEEGMGVQVEGIDFEGEESVDPSTLVASLLHAAEPEKKDLAMAKFERARELFHIGRLVDPQHGPLYHAWGNMEMRRGNATGARHVFTEGIRVNCSDLASLYHGWGLLELHESGGGREKAVSIFRRGIDIGLKGSREVEHGVGFLLHSLGMLELDCNNFAEATKVFEMGVSLFSRHSHMLLGLALAQMKSGLMERARKNFRSSVDADPFHAHAWQAWALAEKQSGNIELARVLLRQGIKKNPTHGALWQAFAVMEMQQGNFEVARSLLAQAVQRAPDHAQSYQAWACLEVRMDNLPAAKGLVMKGLRRVPSHPALWTVAAVVEERLGDPEAARQILKTGINRFPRHGALYKVSGDLECRQGELQTARAVFRRGLEQDSVCASLYHSAALLEARLGNLEGLSELHRRASEHFTPTQRSGAGEEEQGTGGSNSEDIIDRIGELISMSQAAIAALDSQHSASTAPAIGQFGASEDEYMYNL